MRRITKGAGVAAGALLVTAPAAHATDFTVTNLTDGAEPGPAGSLRDAINDANAAPSDDRILFDASLSGAIEVAGMRMLITDAVEIVGPGDGEIAIDGYYGTNRIFTTNPGTAGDAVEISGLTLAYGHSTGSGGAIYNDDAKLTLDDMVLTGNTAAGANLAGGAIVDAAHYANGSQTTIRNTSIVGNAATNGSAGAIGVAGPGGQLGTIVDSTIANNYADNTGGGILAATGGGTIQNSTIANNEAGNDGGGLAIPGTGGPNPLIDNSIVAQNTAADTGDDLFGTVPIDARFSLLENTTGVTVNETVAGSNITGSSARLPESPGYYTGVIVPDPDSPVIDQGRTAAGSTTDQRGEPRPFDLPDFANSAAAGADGADMGAVELTTDETTPVDLDLELSDNPDPVFAGEPLTYALQVHNDGPEDGTGVEINTLIPDDATFNAAASPGCTADTNPSGTVVTCLVGSLVSGATQTKAIGVTPLASAVALPYISAYAGAAADQVDPYDYDNFASEDTVVHTRPATTPPPQVTPPVPTVDLAPLIKKCRKRFRGKAKSKARNNCIKKARKKAGAAASAHPESVGAHPWILRDRPPGATPWRLGS